MLDFLSSDIDVVYIASPNSLHFKHAKVAILARKHVIVEKPAVSRPKNGGNWSSWLTSIKSISLKLPATIMSRPLIQSVIFSRTRPSWEPTSPMPSILQKCRLCLQESSPTFSQLKFSGGALMDLGVYPVYAAIRLFGHPRFGSLQRPAASQIRLI